MPAEVSRAAVLVGPRRIEVRALPLPDPTRDSGLVAVEVCGVCGADWPRFTGRRLGATRLPAVLGHEIVGRIVSLGDRLADSTGLREGQRVLIEEPRPCGACRACAVGNIHACVGDKYGGTGIDVAPGLWGGYAEHVHVDHATIMHPLDDTVAPEVYSLAIPVANGLHWTRAVGRLRESGNVLIVGPGQHGLGCVAAARYWGAGEIMVAGRPRDAYRLDVAKRLGATHTFTAADGAELRAMVDEATGGDLADVVVQVAASSTTALADALACAAPLGHVVSAGFAEQRVTLDPDVIIHRQLTVTGVRGRPSAYSADAVALLAEDPARFTPLLTHTYGLDEVERALRVVGREVHADTSVHVNVRP